MRLFKRSTKFTIREQIDAYVGLNSILQGGVVGIIINWDCNLDWGIKDCKPTYTFTNLDVDNGNSGFNFR